MESRSESVPPTEATLAETVRELANQPTSDSRVGHARARALAFAERVTTQGPFAPVAELGWGVNRRLTGAGGSALPALIAYRVFVWLLPFALVTVATLGLLVDHSNVNIERAVDRFGIAGYFAASVAQAAHTGTTSGRISALTIGALILLYETYALVRGVRAVHARAWGLPLTASKRPLNTALVGLAALFAFLLGRAFLDAVARSQDVMLELPLLLVGYAFVPALWLIITQRLPHRAKRWQDLVPGAAFLGVAALVIHALVAFILLPYLDQKQETYGALGLSAGIMLALYATGWAITAAAAINAELCDRRESAHRSEVYA
jgi:uncharacterized BrkB/YihY/UPF0761 family membrane protein